MKYNKSVLPSFPKKNVRIELTSHASKAGGCCRKKTVGRQEGGQNKKETQTLLGSEWTQANFFFFFTASFRGEENLTRIASTKVWVTKKYAYKPNPIILSTINNR